MAVQNSQLIEADPRLMKPVPVYMTQVVKTQLAAIVGNQPLLAEFLRESVSSSRQSSRTLPHSQIVTFNERSVDVVAGRRGCQAFLYHLSVLEFRR